MTDDPAHDTDYHMRLLVDRVPSMLAYWDRDLRCRFANRAYERWFGVDADSLLGQPIQGLLGAELFALNEDYIRAALRGEEQTFERIVPGPGGVQRHSLAHYIPDLVGGVVRGFLVQVTEVTQLKETQAALILERRLRTQIEEHAQRLATMLDERTEMLAVLAHEVRQPLNNASAALQSARQVLHEIGHADATDRMVKVEKVLGQVLSNVDNTLAVAALLARPEPIRQTDTDIDTVMAVAIADLPREERARVRLQRDTSTRTARMDMSLVRLALRNLLSNALNHSPPDAPVDVRLTDSDDPAVLVIDVGDRGRGIDPDILPRLFERGARGSSAFAGHGLGLYIVRQVMALHGGSVEVVQSGPDGTTMRMAIPQTGSD